MRSILWRRVTLIEWGNLITDILPREHLVLEFVPIEEGRRLILPSR